MFSELPFDKGLASAKFFFHSPRATDFTAAPQPLAGAWSASTSCGKRSCDPCVTFADRSEAGTRVQTPRRGVPLINGKHEFLWSSVCARARPRMGKRDGAVDQHITDPLPARLGRDAHVDDFHRGLPRDATEEHHTERRVAPVNNLP